MEWLGVERADLQADELLEADSLVRSVGSKLSFAFTDDQSYHLAQIYVEFATLFVLQQRRIEALEEKLAEAGGSEQ